MYFPASQTTNTTAISTILAATRLMDSTRIVFHRNTGPRAGSKRTHLNRRAGSLNRRARTGNRLGSQLCLKFNNLLLNQVDELNQYCLTLLFNRRGVGKPRKQE